MSTTPPQAHMKEPEMDRKTRKVTAPRPIAAAVAGLAVLIAVFAIPTAAQATASDHSGYARVTDKAAYLALVAAKGVEVLHVDTEHEDADGFWYAAQAAQPGSGTRQMQWNYQPYGMWCGGTATSIDWNPWMNSYWCMADDRMEQQNPGFTAASQQCAQSTGLPWLISDGYSGCDNYYLNRGYLLVYTEPAMGYQCAPWEDSTLNPDGSARCRTQTYDWYTNPQPNSFWAPAPDACTGMPADSNTGGTYRDPAAFAPGTGDGSCTGEAFAPNCAPGNDHRACTGVEPAPKVSASATATVTKTGSATVSDSASATREVKRLVIVKYASKVVRGKKYTGRGVGIFYTHATRTETAQVTVDDVTGTATVTRTCAAETAEAAQACAQAAAEADAATIAQSNADTAARVQAKPIAASQAKQEAVSAAIKAARAVPVTAAQRSRTAEEAMARAKRSLRQRLP